MWPRTSWSLSSLTRNIVLGRASVISPSISIFSSLPMRRGAYLTPGSAAQPACPLEGFLARAHLARVLGGLELGEQIAQLGTGRDPQIGGELAAAQQRLGRAVAAPVERRRQHLAGEAEVRLDRLLGGERPAATGGEPVGDGEQGDVGGDRLGRPQVLVDPAPRQRRLVDHEAEPQVLPGQRLQVAGQPAAGAQATADPADDLRADAVVADEGDVAVALALGRRLADVVQEGAEAQRRAVADLVGERLVEQLPRCLLYTSPSPRDGLLSRMPSSA